MKKLSYTKVDNKYWNWSIFDENNRYFTTNSEGEGIFEVSFSRMDSSRRQLAGTCQFSLSGLSDNWAKRKIRKWMVDTGRLNEDEWD